RCTAVFSHQPPLDDRGDHQHRGHRYPHGDLDEPHFVRQPRRTSELVPEADQQGDLDQPDRAVDQLEPEHRVLAAADREVERTAPKIANAAYTDAKVDRNLSNIIARCTSPPAGSSAPTS